VVYLKKCNFFLEDKQIQKFWKKKFIGI